jgi:hypothetical protein
MRRSLIQVARRIRAEIALKRRPLNQPRENILQNILGILRITGYPLCRQENDSTILDKHRIHVQPERLARLVLIACARHIVLTL